MFLNFVDTLTPWHLRFLYLFQDSKAYCRAKGVTYPDWEVAHISVDHIFPELQERHAFCEQITKELYDRGLVSNIPLTEGPGLNVSLGKWTTEMGDQFIAFISSPLQ